MENNYRVQKNIFILGSDSTVQGEGRWRKEKGRRKKKRRKRRRRKRRRKGRRRGEVRAGEETGGFSSENTIKIP